VSPLKTSSAVDQSSGKSCAVKPSPGAATIGVWLELPPGANLRGEGIPRVLASLIRAAHGRHATRVVLATPGWMGAAVRSFLAESGVPEDAAELVVARRWTERVGAVLEAARRTVVPRVPKIVRRIAVGPLVLLGRLLPRSKNLVYQEMLKLEYRRLARVASRRRDVAVWFVPHPAWRGATALQRPLVVAVPDVVYSEFPEGFDPTWCRDVDAAIRELTSVAMATISYSDHVRDRHVVGHLGVEPERAHTIRHAPIEVDRHLPAGALASGEGGRRRAVEVLNGWLSGRGGEPGSTDQRGSRRARFRVGERPFLFVSSQVRPYKGYVTLVRAFALLRREHQPELELVVTGDLGSGPLTGFAADVRREVARAHLEGDVVSVPGVPPSVHAALYRLAALTVVPSLFEGGFPFQFSESLSVGTPVVMGAIPVVLDVLPRSLADITVFDPRDPVSMASRIKHALANRQQLVAAQLDFFGQLKRRSWEQVAEEYLELFSEAAATGRSRPGVANGRSGGTSSDHGRERQDPLGAR